MCRQFIVWPAAENANFEGSDFAGMNSRSSGL